MGLSPKEITEAVAANEVVSLAKQLNEALETLSAVKLHAEITVHERAFWDHKDGTPIRATQIALQVWHRVPVAFQRPLGEPIPPSGTRQIVREKPAPHVPPPVGR